MQSAEVRQEKEKPRKCSPAEPVQVNGSESDEDPTCSYSVLDVTTRRSHKRIVKKGTEIFVPYDILDSKVLASIFLRNGVKTTAISEIVEGFISACGGDVSPVNVSYVFAYRLVLKTMLVKLRKDPQIPKQETV